MNRMVLHRVRPTALRPAVVAMALGACASLLVPAACTKMPLVAPSGTVITLISTTNSLPVNGSADIIAVLIENGSTSTTTTTPPTTPGGTTTSTPTGTTGAGNPVHNGTVVSFTTTLGRVEPAEAKTTAGQVT